MKEIFVILLSTALLVQAVVRRTGPASAKEPKAWFLAGCGVWLVLAVSAALTAALDLLVLQPLGLGAARLIVMLLLIALCLWPWRSRIFAPDCARRRRAACC